MTFKEMLNDLDKQGAPPDIKIKAAEAYYQTKVLPNYKGAPPDILDKVKKSFEAKYRPDIEGAYRQQELDAAGKQFLQREREVTAQKTKAKLDASAQRLADHGKNATINPKPAGLGNLVDATTKGFQAVPSALSQFAIQTPGAIMGGLTKEGQANINAVREGKLLDSIANPLNPESAIRAFGQGALGSARDIVQGGADIFKDIANTYAGGNVYVNPLGTLPEVPRVESRPASSFIGEQVPFLLPIGRAVEAGAAGESLQALLRPVAENAAIMGAIDPKGSNRVTNAGFGAALGLAGVGVGAVGKGVIQGVKEVLPGRVRPEIKPEVVAEPITPPVIKQVSGRVVPDEVAAPAPAEAVGAPPVPPQRKPLPQIFEEIKQGAPVVKEEVAHNFAQMDKVEIERELSKLDQNAINEIGKVYNC